MTHQTPFDPDDVNPTDNPTFGEILNSAVSRRGFLRATAVVGVGTAAAGSSFLQQPQVAAAAPGGRGLTAALGLNFTPINPNQRGLEVTTPEGYAQKVVIRWGDPLLKGVAEFDRDKQSEKQQQASWGYNNDMLVLAPTKDDDVALLVCNFEYTDEWNMFPGWKDASNATQTTVDVGIAAHGVGIVAVRKSKKDGSLTPIVGHPLNRRIHGKTEFEVAGPLKGSDYLKTKDDPTGTKVLGTLNNCAGGWTPWGTYLTCEENFDQYFGNYEKVEDADTREGYKRMGFEEGPSDRGWEKFYDRFDMTKEPKEAQRFGYVCEIDPYDPESTPVKHTALGRYRHEGCAIRVTDDGRIAAYSGDDAKGEYIYKFVSDGEYRKDDKKGNSKLFDLGTLYVAKMDMDASEETLAEFNKTGQIPEGGFAGTGTWMALAHGDDSYVPGMTAEEVYVHTRKAADIMTATRMDRPEDFEPNPKSGVVYLALTNNSDRGEKYPIDEANPRLDNKSGHVLEVHEKGNDAAATKFGWNIFLLCGDPNDPTTYYAGFDKSQVSPISCPDNVTFDPYGNLWISTDGNPSTTKNNDGLYGVAVEGKFRGQVKQFLAVPAGAETCGPWIEEKRVLVNVQHPGDVENDGTPSVYWPEVEAGINRPSTVVVWPKNYKHDKIGVPGRGRGKH